MGWNINSSKWVQHRANLFWYAYKLLNLENDDLPLNVGLSKLFLFITVVSCFFAHFGSLGFYLVKRNVRIGQIRCQTWFIGSDQNNRIIEDRINNTLL